MMINRENNAFVITKHGTKRGKLIMEKQQLVKLLNDLFLPLGFKKKGNNWIFDGQMLIKIVNLQRSNFSKLYYLNYNFVIKKLDLGGLKSHIFYRLRSGDGSSVQPSPSLLDLEYGIDEAERISKLKNIISEQIINKFQLINDEEDLLKEIKNLPNTNMVPLVVKKHFNLN